MSLFDVWLSTRTLAEQRLAAEFPIGTELQNVDGIHYYVVGYDWPHDMVIVTSFLPSRWKTSPGWHECASSLLRLPCKIFRVNGPTSPIRIYQDELRRREESSRKRSQCPPPMTRAQQAAIDSIGRPENQGTALPTVQTYPRPMKPSERAAMLERDTRVDTTGNGAYSNMD